MFDTTVTLTKARDSKALLWGLYLSIFALLSAIYVLHISSAWKYMGFSYEPSAENGIVSALVLSAFVAVTPVRNDPRSFFLNLALTIYLVPSLVLFTFAGKPLSSALIVWGALAIVYAVSAIQLPRLRLARIDTRLFTISIGIGTALLMAAFLFFGATENFNLDIRKVYEFRQAAAHALPATFGYVVPIFTKILIPMAIVFALYHRAYWAALIFFGAAVAVFGFTSHKSVLLSAALPAALYLLLSVTQRYSFVLIALFLILLLAAADALMWMTTETRNGVWGWFSSILVRRGLLVPSLLDYNYIEFFSGNSQYYWAHSKITLGLVTSPYDVTPPRLIGAEFFDAPKMSANTGFIGSGFAQAGMIGTALYALGAGLVIAILQAFGRKLGLPLVAAFMAYPVATMVTSTDFLTLFMTHGLLASFVILASINVPPRGKGLFVMPVPRVVRPILIFPRGDNGLYSPAT